jgi:hypothetical protein
LSNFGNTGTGQIDRLFFVAAEVLHHLRNHLYFYLSTISGLFKQSQLFPDGSKIVWGRGHKSQQFKSGRMFDCQGIRMQGRAVDQGSIHGTIQGITK